MEMQTGNVNELGKNNREWIVGHFMKEGTPFHTQNAEIKWVDNQKGFIKKGFPNRITTQTLYILISGKLKVRMPDINQEKILTNEGDYLIFDSSICFHESEIIEDAKFIVIRWPSLPDNTVTEE